MVLITETSQTNKSFTSRSFFQVQGINPAPNFPDINQNKHPQDVAQDQGLTLQHKGSTSQLPMHQSTLQMLCVYVVISAYKIVILDFFHVLAVYSPAYLLSQLPRYLDCLPHNCKRIWYYLICTFLFVV